MLLQAYNMIVYRDVSLPVLIRDVFDGLGMYYKRFIFHLIETVKYPGSKDYGT